MNLNQDINKIDQCLLSVNSGHTHKNVSAKQVYSKMGTVHTLNIFEAEVPFWQEPAFQYQAHGLPQIHVNLDQSRQYVGGKVWGR